MNSSVGILPQIAYRIATEPDFFVNLPCSRNAIESLHLMDQDEQDAIEELVKQGLNHLLNYDAEDAPLEGYWWTSTAK
ncbi:hypothetical protein EG832_00900 [bacterium]|nr:hypothetical protein [bacterium]